MPTTEEGSQEVQEKGHDGYMERKWWVKFRRRRLKWTSQLVPMAHENEVNTETPIDFIFEKLHEVFYDLIDELKKLGVKNKELKSKNQFLLKKIKIFQIKN